MDKTYLVKAKVSNMYVKGMWNQKVSCCEQVKEGGPERKQWIRERGQKTAESLEREI